MSDFRKFRWTVAAFLVAIAGRGSAVTSDPIDILVKTESPCYWQAYPSGMPAWNWGACASATVTVSNLVARTATVSQVAKGPSAWGTVGLPATDVETLFDITVALDSGTTLTGRVARVPSASVRLRGNPSLRVWSKQTSDRPMLFHHDATRNGLSPETAALALQIAGKSAVQTNALAAAAGYETIVPPTGARVFDATLLYDGDPFATSTFRISGGAVLIFK